MKIILIGSFPVCLSVYNSLSKDNHLDAVCFQESEVPNPKKNFWLTSIQKEGLDTFLINKQNIYTEFKTWLEDKAPDLVLVCGFSIKIPKAVLGIPTHGFLNVHFGKLPENRGPDPLFWSIKQGKKQSAITIHQMDENWDTGNILIEQPVPIIPGETLGMANSKMSYMLGGLTQKALELIVNPENLKPQSDKNTHYNQKPTEKDTIIHWETQTADEIEQLINACNPKYGGATTYYQGSPIKIIEVSPVDTQPLLGKTAGEIIHAHPQEGLYVYCKYGKLLKINTISSDAGVLSGIKYVHLGVRQGHCFTTSLQKKQRAAI
ncbi:methionyl-tRNA formyltransferase [Aquimarina sp. 2201CG14-23]|uniref:methionyl-tRNA formyltransferase n=1 Tax=Aquimarina mycalae TaxID=3040073 RepID=UPI0024781147|nr:formyltransferase family protein [Aquimarina sp. 2201CG14-23]MDH7445464.1 formyltransferase family protein [Aquimarina sp. 2201CG14-23]